MTVAEVMLSVPAAVEAALTRARERLCLLVGDDAADLMEQRLSSAAQRWQARAASPPGVPLRRLDESLRRHLPWRRVLVGAAAMLLVAGGTVAVVSGMGRHGDTPPAAADPSPAPSVHRAVKTVPFRDLAPAHPALGRDENGTRVTPYDHVTATGDISGTVHPGDTLVFEAALEAPGLLSLLPVPRLHDHVRHPPHDAAAELRPGALLRQPGPVDRQGDRVPTRAPGRHAGALPDARDRPRPARSSAGAVGPGRTARDAGVLRGRRREVSADRRVSRSARADDGQDLRLGEQLRREACVRRRG